MVFVLLSSSPVFWFCLGVCCSVVLLFSTAPASSLKWTEPPTHVFLVCEGINYSLFVPCVNQYILCIISPQPNMFACLMNWSQMYSVYLAQMILTWYKYFSVFWGMKTLLLSIQRALPQIHFLHLSCWLFDWCVCNATWYQFLWSSVYSPHIQIDTDIFTEMLFAVLPNVICYSCCENCVT